MDAPVGLTFLLLSLVLIALAIPMIKRRVKPNRFYGLRMRETLEHEGVWYAANERAGRDLLSLGVVSALLSGGVWLFQVPAESAALACSLWILFGSIFVAIRGVLNAKKLYKEMK